MVNQARNGGHATRYGYVAGYLAVETNPNGNTTTLTVDGAGNVIVTRDAQGNTSTARYDADNEIVKSSDADGRTITFAYDPRGQLARQVWYNAARVFRLRDKIRLPELNTHASSTATGRMITSPAFLAS
jgi:YD repeat-containing protein